MNRREAEGWTLASQGDEEDRMRLTDLVGCAGLRERADDPTLRLTAIRSMAFCTDFSELGWLAEVGASVAPEGVDALDAIVREAERPRRTVDPEDAEELTSGCATLLGIAQSKAAARTRRVLAIRSLRMLTDRGCAKPEDIPHDLDP